MKLDIQNNIQGRGASLLIAIPVFAFLLLFTSHLSGFFEPKKSTFADLIRIEKQDGYEVSRTFLGRVEATEMSETGFEVSGTIDRVYTDEGEHVKQGQILARLNTDRLEAIQREAVATLNESKAQLALSKSTLKRIQAAIAVKAVSSQELDEAIQSRNLAEAQVMRHEAALERIEVDLEKSILRAPYNAKIITRYTNQGRVVDIGDPVLRLKKKSDFEVRIGLANDFSDTLKIGQEISVKINNKQIVTTVKSMLGVRDERTHTVDVFLTLPQSVQVRPGDLASLTLNERLAGHGFWVPMSALTENIRGLWSLYSINENSITERKVVDLIHIEDRRAFVRGNFANGETIVADGVHRLVPGLAIVPQNPISISQD